MKKIKTIGLAVAAAILLASCGPKKISDREMTDILFDIFLMNGYVTNMPYKIRTDTVDIYEPLLADYGYTVEDFLYTLNRMAMKKSSRLSELLKNATHRLQAEDRYFTAREKMWASIDSAAIAAYNDTVYRMDDRTLRFDSKDKADSMKFSIPVSPGKYRLTYKYFIDTLDQNTYYNLRYNFRTTHDRVAGSGSRVLTKRRPAAIEVQIDSDPNYTTLEINLVNASNLTHKPYVTVDSVYIVYHEPLETLRRRITRRYLGFDSENHLPYEPNEEDSVALRTVPPLRLDTARVAEF